MTDDRRMTADRFYGGVSNRLHNLRSMLAHVRDESPTRNELNQWVIENTRAGSSDAVSHHLTFLESIRLIELSGTGCELDKYGQQWLEYQTPETLYEALSSGVKGFDTILESLQDGSMTDEDIMDLLVGEFDEAQMSKPGPAVRHREWLQVLGFVEREDGVNRLTPGGRELLEGETETEPKARHGTDEPTQRVVERERTRLENATDSEPQLTDDEERYTEARRRARDTAFSELVRRAYDTTCAICGRSRETPNGNPEVEAAHIYPKQEGGADDVRNGIALCKLHHWAFDTGWLAISDEHEILVKEAPDRNGYHEFKRLEEDEIVLPDEEQAEPHPMFLTEHRQRHGFNDD